MNFFIADTFQDSLSRLTADEQKAVKTTAFDLQMNPANPGFKLHKLDRAKDKNFWSARASSDLRIIVHRDQASLLLCYVDHHDKAYSWAERRKLEVHPKTGAAQFVEIREVQTVLPVVPDVPAPPGLLAKFSADELLGYGVPEEWLADVQAADEEALLALASRLPAEAAEAVLELAVGGTPRINKPTGFETTPFDHPDAQRRFRLLNNPEELRQALDYPWDKWLVFLHPEQRALVSRDFNGPARVGGSAGTGKTIVALHRAVALARRYREARVLLATFSEPLASALRLRLKRLLATDPLLLERIDVYAFDALAKRLYELTGTPVTLAGRAEVRALLRPALQEMPDARFNEAFVMAEWEQVVDAWQARDWDSYRSTQRLGRKSRLSESQRKALWQVFERVYAGLAERGLMTPAALYSRLAGHYQELGKSPYQFAVIDEAQDISVMQLRTLVGLIGTGENALFFAGDLGQRIFQSPFSWKAQGVDLRGRSRTLRVNYRTSHQIRQQADKLLNPTVADPDGNEESRRDTVSVFNGASPQVQLMADAAAEGKAVADWLRRCGASGVAPHEIGVFVRSDAEVPRALDAVLAAGLSSVELDERVETTTGKVSISTMHLAKGLEFRAVAVMACDEGVLPLESRLDQAGDQADIREIYETERHLLYVACTRARDNLLVTGVRPGSEFLGDMGA
jgi:superfamily I DNA/RNA helicase/mRNA-degrading endonuclease RelE of RelBE toxin-antitoxin system